MIVWARTCHIHWRVGGGSEFHTRSTFVTRATSNFTTCVSHGATLSVLGARRCGPNTSKTWTCEDWSRPQRSLIPTRLLFISPMSAACPLLRRSGEGHRHLVCCIHCNSCCGSERGNTERNI